jgi:lysozyme
VRDTRKGKAIAKKYESLRLKAYLCPAGIPTFGWGTTRGVTHADVKSGRTITIVMADALFEEDWDVRERLVLAICKVAPSDNELAALTSCAYNIGIEGLQNSSIMKAHNRGDHKAAAKAFALWNKARVNGVLTELRGLTARRAAEAALYLEPDEELHFVAEPAVAHVANAEEVFPMPQKVEAPKALASSRIVQAGTASALMSGLAAVKEGAQQFSGLQDALASIPAWVVPAVLAIVACTAIYTVCKRVQQRRDGVA